METINRNLCQYLRDCRIATPDMTQQQLAGKLGFQSPQFISNIERAKCNSPFAVMAAYIKYCGADPKKLEEIEAQHFRRNLRKARRSRAV